MYVNKIKFTNTYSPCQFRIFCRTFNILLRFGIITWIITKNTGSLGLVQPVVCCTLPALRSKLVHSSVHHLNTAITTTSQLHLLNIIIIDKNTKHVYLKLFSPFCFSPPNLNNSALPVETN